MKRPPLSPKAQKLWKRIQHGAWYSTSSPRTPAAMQELIEAGLVVTGGRVKSMESCFVPKGTKPFKLERYPEVKE